MASEKHDIGTGAKPEVKEKQLSPTRRVGDGDYDPFIIQAVYPDAAAIFSSTFKSLKEIRDAAVVVMDTNALLVPYGIGKQGLDRIRATYRKLADEKRLVIPGQVAREFARNRVEKLKELHGQLMRRSQIAVPSSASPLFAGLAEYKEVERIESEFAKLIRDYQEQIQKLLYRVRAWQSDDPVSLMYREVFTLSVVLDPAVDKKEIEADLLRRTTHQIPPGYKDASKDDGGIGDLLIWHTILEVGRKRKQDVIFVSGDEKADWWHRSEGRPLYPRFELVDEFRRNSEGCTLHLMKFAELLELFDADRTLVDAVRVEEWNATVSNVEAPEQFAVNPAVLKWVQANYPLRLVAENPPELQCDYLMIDEAGALTAVEIVTDPGARKFRMDKLVSVGMRVETGRDAKGRSISWLVIVVAPNRKVIQHAIQNLRAIFYSMGAQVILGLIGADGNFCPHARFSEVGFSEA